MIRAAIAVVLFVMLSVPLPSSGALAQQDDMIFDPTTIVIVTQRQGQHRLRVQLAETMAQLMHGLMFRKTLKPYAGMLFDFGTTVRAHIWMKNTYIPLDIIFVRDDGSIESIVGGVPESRAIKSSRGLVRAVIELRRGTAKRFGIAPGDTVRHRIFGNSGK